MKSLAFGAETYHTLGYKENDLTALILAYLHFFAIETQTLSLVQLYQALFNACYLAVLSCFRHDESKQ